MLAYPQIDPVAISLGPLDIHWYGIMYLIGFAVAWWLAKRRAAQPNSGWNNVQVADMVFYGAMGAVLGGRAGYMLFYNLQGLVSEPLSLFYIWQGGMSFHGGFLGVIIAAWLFARRYQKSLFDVLDFLAPMVPIGLGAGRIGNFIGAELWGRTSDVPWAMVFPGAGPLARHPSQLYQAFLEGLVLFALLWWFSKKPRPRFAVSGLFCLAYGCFRFIVEFFREPDAGIGFVAFDWMTRGQQLSLPMILAGALALYLAYRYDTFTRLAGRQG